MTNHNGHITGVANSVNDRFPAKVRKTQRGGGVAINNIGVILVGRAHAEEQNAVKSIIAATTTNT